MRPNAQNLAMRDPALAALMGAFKGGNFGFEGSRSHAGSADFGDDYGAEFGDDMGDDDVGDDMGAEFGAAARTHRPSEKQMLHAWHKQRKHSHRTEKRNLLLEPNKGSEIKVERYSFSINQDIILGTAVGLSMSGNPDTTIRPQRATMNAPSNGFAQVTEIKVANVSVTVGGTGDAFEYSPLGVGMSLDMPTLSPANRATVLGFYTGFVPPGFVLGSAYKFAASFKGPATIVA
jgi:hypothetical protein